MMIGKVFEMGLNIIYTKCFIHMKNFTNNIAIVLFSELILVKALKYQKRMIGRMLYDFEIPSNREDM